MCETRNQFRGSRWWIAYYAPQGGQSVEQREPGGRTEADARRLLRQRVRELADHKTRLRAFQGPRQERLTVEDMLQVVEQDYQIRGRKSYPERLVHLRLIRAFFGMDRALTMAA
jgi:hypothetical protein